MKHLLTIAGSDCSGGAGIQADLKTFAAHGTYGMSVVTSVVAENTSRVISLQDVAPDVIGDQLDAVFEDIRVDGVKIGMLSGEAAMRIVAERLRKYSPPRPVIDPVMVATSGDALMRKDAMDALLREILPLAYLLTPNIPEAEAITGSSIKTREDMRQAAADIRSLGPANVLIKGGHLSGDAEDILYDGERYHSFTTCRVPSNNTHGTGCTLSSAIAVRLSQGHEAPEAVRLAKEYVTGAISHGLPIGKGHGPTHHFYKLYSEGEIE